MTAASIVRDFTSILQDRPPAAGRPVPGATITYPTKQSLVEFDPFAAAVGQGITNGDYMESVELATNYSVDDMEGWIGDVSSHIGPDVNLLANRQPSHHHAAGRMVFFIKGVHPKGLNRMDGDAYELYDPVWVAPLTKEGVLGEMATREQMEIIYEGFNGSAHVSDVSTEATPRNIYNLAQVCGKNFKAQIEELDSKADEMIRARRAGTITERDSRLALGDARRAWNLTDFRWWGVLGSVDATSATDEWKGDRHYAGWIQMRQYFGTKNLEGSGVFFVYGPVRHPWFPNNSTMRTHLRLRYAGSSRKDHSVVTSGRLFDADSPALVGATLEERVRAMRGISQLWRQYEDEAVDDRVVHAASMAKLEKDRQAFMDRLVEQEKMEIELGGEIIEAQDEVNNAKISYESLKSGNRDFLELPNRTYSNPYTRATSASIYGPEPYQRVNNRGRRLMQELEGDQVQRLIQAYGRSIWTYHLMPYCSPYAINCIPHHELVRLCGDPTNPNRQLDCGVIRIGHTLQGREDHEMMGKIAGDFFFNMGNTDMDVVNLVPVADPQYTPLMRAAVARDRTRQVAGSINGMEVILSHSAKMEWHLPPFPDRIKLPYTLPKVAAPNGYKFLEENATGRRSAARESGFGAATATATAKRNSRQAEAVAAADLNDMMQNLGLEQEEDAHLMMTDSFTVRVTEEGDAMDTS